MVQFDHALAAEMVSRLTDSVLEPKRVLVTGVGGFIGGFVARDLAQRGYEVIGTARNPARVPRPVAEACHALRQVVIGESTDWSDLLPNVVFVIHCAAHVHVRRPSLRDTALFQQVNVEGVRALAASCRRHEVELFINLSSIAANAPVVDEKSNGYGRSKAEAEQAVAAELDGSGCRYLNLRLPAVYGPSGKGSLDFLFRLVGFGLPLPMIVGSPKRSYLSVWNLADCISHCLLTAPQKSCTVAIADDVALDLEELLTVIASARGKRLRVIRLGRWALRFAAVVSGHGRELQRGMVSTVIDPADALAKLGWRPNLLPAECWARVAAA
jgi:nucleoside-diphosphate-sugar epimerase